MTKKLAMLLPCLCLFLCACSGGVRMPEYAFDYVGEPVGSVESDMEALGFTDVVTTEVENDKGLDSEGDVSRISIAGDSSFEEGQSFPADSRVSIDYYGEYSQERQEQDRIREEQEAAERAAAEKAAAEKAAADKAAAEQAAQGQGDGQSQNSAEATADFKAAMDSYEQFFNDYVDYMKLVQSTDDAGAILDGYADYMAQYADTMAKMDAIDTESLSPEDYAYYIEVHGRILKKLAELY